jgi:hypothetical protein
MGQKIIKFEEVLVEAVDEGLLMLGESGREIVYYQLQNSYGVEKEGIPNNLEVFTECLKKIFGSGSMSIEQSIIKILYRKIGIEYVEKKDYSFSKYVDDAKSVAKKKLIGKRNYRF